jgi:hypothetical protein
LNFVCAFSRDRQEFSYTDLRPSALLEGSGVPSPVCPAE